jgi:ABC-type antimicrobial peptide transport system permease subunit
MAVVSLFAAAASFLAFVGVYAVMAYSVAQQSREIGVRMALGASPGDIAARVLRHGAVLTGAGMAIGLAMSAALGGLLAALLFGVKPLDGLTYGAVSLLAATAGLIATSIPAFIAARVDPSVALAAE